jgi:tagatose-6-phosphate ketose/aldose isomerase
MINSLHELTLLSKEELRERGIEYTPKEIESQPKLWIKNFEKFKEREEKIVSFIKSHILAKRSKVILSGAGTSAYVGLSVQNLLRSRWSTDVDARPTVEIVTNWNSIFLKQEDYTLVSIARSGNSPESVGAFNLANKYCKKISHIIITCNEDGKLAKKQDKKGKILLLLLSPETNDKGLAMTSSFSSMLMAAQFLAYIEDLKQYRKIIEDLSEATEELFESYSGLIKNISELNFERGIFLGSGALYGCAVESQLKLEEMTAGHVICKADSFMGVRHGPAVTINDKALVVYFLSTDPLVRRYEMDLMKNINNKKLGLNKIVVCDKSNSEIEALVDHVIEFNRDNIFEIPDLCRPIMDVTIGQMLGLFKSLDLGLKPDKPDYKDRITRVVKGVEIYDDKVFRNQ